MMAGKDEKNHPGDHCKTPESIKKYPLDCNASAKEIFSMPFLCDINSISNIKKHGRIMFIIRGPPYTMKTKLSDLLKEIYPNAVYCSAVKLITDGKIDKSVITSAHTNCQKKVEVACLKNELIILQNSHIKRYELKSYLNLAAKYDFTVIMAITTYKFDITIEALEKAEKQRNGVLGNKYLNNALRHWEDVPPMYTGWFISPEDSECLRCITLQILETLSHCDTVLKHLPSDDITNYFHPRQMLGCLAGYTKDQAAMKKYYMSDLIQLSYGKCFIITIVGYLVTTSDIIGIVHLNRNMKSLILYDLNEDDDESLDQIPGNASQHGKTVEFCNKEKYKPGIIVENNWLEGEEINIAMSSFMHIAQRNFNVFNLQKLRKDFKKSLQFITDTNGIIHQDVYIDDGTTKFCKLRGDALLIKAPQKILMNAIFTGFYPN
ncbi:2',3'-cyclic-nucleotide 3'-phosphodiesterase-like [Parasteatoda tepidariorum]|uniref:2',3'-cyclic-nucleotide 3'-phosphodiesterase-like n=1 Tax=Parasteatoda tepidariorum TaxID=114398 RepID=UPI00077F9D33|nr:uncharacterized protein LOC107446140 [Parasteatoda tepidariorum]